MRAAAVDTSHQIVLTGHKQQLTYCHTDIHAQYTPRATQLSSNTTPYRNHWL